MKANNLTRSPSASNVPPSTTTATAGTVGLNTAAGPRALSTSSLPLSARNNASATPRASTASSHTAGQLQFNNESVRLPDALLASAQPTVTAATVHNLKEFRDILNESTSAAPPGSSHDAVRDLARTISALASRVPTLSLDEQIGAFNALVTALKNRPLLAKMVNLPLLRHQITNRLDRDAQNSRSSVENRTQLVQFRGFNESQMAAVTPDNDGPTPALGMATTGRDVRQIAAEHNITHLPAIYELERASINSLDPNSAGTHAREGRGSAVELAEQHGFITAAGLGHLRDEVFYECALPAVLNGSDPGHVANALDINDPARIVELEGVASELGRRNNAAEALVELSESVNGATKRARY